MHAYEDGDIVDLNLNRLRELDDILRRCEETVALGGTQIMFQGGHHPDYGVEGEVYVTAPGAEIEASHPLIAAAPPLTYNRTLFQA